MLLDGAERAEDVRRMTITDDGTGDRTVRVSYISEVPVWKSTYRILLPSDATGKPLVQRAKPDSCQPPITASTKPCASCASHLPRPNGISAIKFMLIWWVKS